ncbi:MAG: chemotaxis protein CheV [Thiohalomonadales bacterium]
MASVLDGVDRRTQLVGANRLELLLFRLNGQQLYGINVFKVQEVIRCPKLNRIPHSDSAIMGVATMRGKTISIIDLAYAMGGARMDEESLASAFVVIADYNRSTQGFLVRSVDRIVNMNWEKILAPPPGAGGSTYLTAVTDVESKLVEIIDVEKILAELMGTETSVSEKIVEEKAEAVENKYHILVADDSMVARKQIQRTLDQLNLKTTLVKDGEEALNYMLGLEESGEHVSLLISDIEMPNMDGYTLTTELRKHPKFGELYIILHTSLSGVFNQAMVKKVGADAFIAKFSPDELAGATIKGLEVKFGENGAI